MHIVLAGGGTAGHIEPALNTADEIRSRNCGDSISILGTSKGLESVLVPARGYSLTLIPPVPLPRRINKDLFTLPSRLHEAIGQTKHHLIESKASVVVGFGGYVALPAYFAAKALNIPIVVHEANAKPGLANKIGARFATKVVETVEGSISNAIQIGLPLRYSIAHFDKSQNRSAGLGLWNLDAARPTILVFGGSQGARRLNELCAGAVAKFPEGIQVLHIAGALDFDRVSQIAGARANHRVLGFCDQMPAAYAVADLIISRSGASSLTEISIAGRPSILVPFPYAADDHQTRNAEVFERAGAAKLVQERDLDEGKLAALALSILNDPAISERMAAAARSLAIPDAAERVCAAIEATFSNP